MNIIVSVDIDEDWKREIFQTTVPMSTYLIAFSISGKTLVTLLIPQFSNSLRDWKPNSK